MSDKELLELAAKAAGVEYDLYGDDFYIPEGEELQRPWNPLTDDGDALRLAVKLAQPDHLFTVYFGDKIVIAECQLGDGEETDFIERHNNDPYAATRKAIVKAAAEIGRGME